MQEGMTMADDADSLTYIVVRNDEEQFSIWAADRELPPGWQPEGTSGPQSECLARIDEIWTDMRPRSLREAMESMEG
jgi:MbtH protein